LIRFFLESPIASDFGFRFIRPTRMTNNMYVQITNITTSITRRECPVYTKKAEEESLSVLTFAGIFGLAAVDHVAFTSNIIPQRRVPFTSPILVAAASPIPFLRTLTLYHSKVIIPSECWRRYTRRDAWWMRLRRVERRRSMLRVVSCYAGRALGPGIF
jgi:hypothetical protein